jgi:hypothetical protein
VRHPTRVRGHPLRLVVADADPRSLPRPPRQRTIPNRIKRFLPAARPRAVGRSWDAGPGRQWREAHVRFLAAVDPELRPAVAALLRHLPERSAGLHTWLCCLAWGKAFLPVRLPREVIQVYLDDPEAAPLYECRDCRLDLPVRPGRRWALADPPERIYFPACPACGGATGWCRPL